VKIARSKFKSDLKFEIPLAVVKNYELNYMDAQYLMPFVTEECKRFEYSSKVLRMAVSGPLTAFTQGQEVKFSVSYNNESMYEVLSTEISLIQCVKSSVNQSEKIEKFLINSEKFEGVDTSYHKNVEVSLKIPFVPPSSSEETLKTITASYEIFVKAIFVEGISDHIVRIPIIIGTIPLSTQSVTNVDKSKELPSYPSLYPLPTAPEM
jgi:hypothetical protein